VLERSPSHAARQRRYRRRQRNGELLVSITATPAEVDVLHRLGYLDLGRLEDRAAIADALHQLVANIILD
jgi:hypothetical protein